MRKSLALAVVLPLAVAPVVATPAQAQSIVKQKLLQQNIKQGYQAKGIKVAVKCPKRVTWARGKTFTCKVTDTAGNRATVLVTLGSEAKGKLRWKQL